MCACNVFYILACGLDRTYHAHQFIFSFFRLYLTRSKKLTNNSIVSCAYSLELW